MPKLKILEKKKEDNVRNAEALPSQSIPYRARPLSQSQIVKPSKPEPKVGFG